MPISPELQDVTLELSLRPFTEPGEEAIRARAREIFIQWLPLTRRAKSVSLMMWTSDGSEILDYTGDLTADMEWSHTVGVANPRGAKLPASDPNHLSIHHTPRDFMENPPKHTYGWYQRFLSILKEVGNEVFGVTPHLGATFDPGPEFAKSTFKYERHPEICLAATMGKESFVVCYATLKQDSRAYAGFPKGIPEGTSFGAFLGGQSERFLADMGFDFLWLSNGFGFGMETWGMYGAVFNGKAFEISRAADVRKKCLDFWTDFRGRCPKILLRTRGTNQTTGRDLAADGVPLDEIYRGGFNLEPPPNSPWAALNGDFGLELAGWMSRVAEIPGQTWPYRFYTHDLWFANSPWLDRYGREPHDIFLPMAISRIDGNGDTQTPTGINLLSVDDTYGKTPEIVPLEVIPHMVECLDTAPDRPGLLTWVYPWDEYHRDSKKEDGIGEVFFGDWYIRSAIGAGLPLNTVVSTRTFRKLATTFSKSLAGTILVSPFPRDEDLAALFMDFADRGGQVLFYGPVTHGAPSLQKRFGLELAETISGEIRLSVEAGLAMPPGPDVAEHVALSSGGGLDVASVGKDWTVTARARHARGERVYGFTGTTSNGGRITWVRGTNGFVLPEFKGAHLPDTRSAETHCRVERLLRIHLETFGVGHGVFPSNLPAKDPIVTVHRHRNAFYFAGFNPNTRTRQSFSLPWGAPLFTGLDTGVEGRTSDWHLPKAWRHECRLFVDQPGTAEVSVTETASVMFGIRRRLRVRGLRKATLRFFPEPGSRPAFLHHPKDPFLSGDFMAPALEETPQGPCYRLDGVDEDLMISW